MMRLLTWLLGQEFRVRGGLISVRRRRRVVCMRKAIPRRMLLLSSSGFAASAALSAVTVPAAGCNVRGGLHGLDHGASLAGASRRGPLGNLDEYQIAQGALRMIGDADLDGAVLPCAHPFVALGVSKSLGMLFTLKLP